MSKKQGRPRVHKTGTVVYGEPVSSDSAVTDFDYEQPESSYTSDAFEIFEKHFAKNVKPKKLVIESDGTTQGTHLFLDGVEIVGLNWIIFEADSAKPVISLNLKLSGVQHEIK